MNRLPKKKLVPHAAETLPRLADPRDERASLHDRSRAYLHANCSHCHVRSGGGNSVMQLASHFSDAAMSVFGIDPVHNTFGIPDAKLASARAPERSLLVYRPALRGLGQMPPVGSVKPDGEGVALLAKWLASVQPGAETR